MSTNRDFELLADLAKLLNKYGPKAFESLAHQLADPELSKNLIDVLLGSAAAWSSLKRRSSSTPRASLHNKMRETLRSLGDSEPEKAKALERFYEALTTKTILPNLRDLRIISSEAGLLPIKAKSREKAVIPFMRSLTKLTLPEIESIWSRVELIDKESDRSLEGWSRIIFEDRKPTKD